MKINTSIRKRFRVSNKVKKVASKDRFRLSISRTSKNISAQIIDDRKNITLLSSSSIDKDMKSSEKISKTDLSKKVAELISKGSVIGWFQGRSEFGPRALGNRSILADPRNTEMQKKLNLKREEILENFFNIWSISEL